MQYPGFKQIINKPGHTEEVMKVEETKTIQPDDSVRMKSAKKILP